MLSARAVVVDAYAGLGLHLWTPQPTRDYTRTNALVSSFRSNSTQSNALGRAVFGEHTPHQSGTIIIADARCLGSRINKALSTTSPYTATCCGEKLDGVGFCLDFNPANVAIDPGDIDLAVTIIKDEGVGSSLDVRQR